MRILEFITPSRIAGAETQVATIIQTLQALGDEVVVFCPMGRALVGYLRERGIDVVTWRTTGKIDPLTVVKLASLIRRKKIDVVHTHLSSASLLGSLAGKLASVPVVATVHGFTRIRYYRRAERIIAVSESIRENMMRQGFPDERIDVVYNGIDIDAFPPTPLPEAKLTCGFEAGVLRAGAFRRIMPEKGLDVAIRAWSQVVRVHPSAVLMIVGEGCALQELTELVRSLNLSDNVVFPGFTPDPVNLMSACDIILVPSLREAFGVAAIEGMALERPVIASDTGGLAEIITQRQDGVLCPPGDDKSLADALLWLFEHPVEASRIATAGRRTVEERFDGNQQIKQIRDVLEKAVQDYHKRIGSAADVLDAHLR